MISSIYLVGSNLPTGELTQVLMQQGGLAFGIVAILLIIRVASLKSTRRA
ncbi:MAG: hypothetical protein AAF741_01675 [Bacteroidota bacterium]